MMTDHGDELGADRSQRHWRLVSVQAGGGLTIVRQRTRRSMQQFRNVECAHYRRCKPSLARQGL